MWYSNSSIRRQTFSNEWYRFHQHHRYEIKISLNNLTIIFAKRYTFYWSRNWIRLIENYMSAAGQLLQDRTMIYLCKYSTVEIFIWLLSERQKVLIKVICSNEINIIWNLRFILTRLIEIETDCKWSFWDSFTNFLDTSEISSNSYILLYIEYKNSGLQKFDQHEFYFNFLTLHRFFGLRKTNHWHDWIKICIQ